MFKLECKTSLNTETGTHAISFYDGKQLIVGAVGSKASNEQSSIAAVALNYAIEEIEMLRAELAQYQSTDKSADDVIVVEKTQFESKLKGMMNALDEVA